MDMLTDTQLLVMRLSTEYDADRRRELLSAYLEESGLPFYKDSLSELVFLITEAYQLGVDQAY